MQEWLTELGYNPGGIDGIVCPKTTDALFIWISEIADPDVQQSARVAAHNEDYEALSDMLYMQLINPDGAATAGNDVAVEQPVQQPLAAPPAQDTPGQDSTAGLAQDVPASPAENQAGDNGQDDDRETELDANHSVEDYRTLVNDVLSTDFDESAFTAVNLAYNQTYSGIEGAYDAELKARGLRSVTLYFIKFYEDTLRSSKNPSTIAELTKRTEDGYAYLALKTKYDDMLRVVADTHNEATTQIRERLMARAEAAQPINPIPDETQTGIAATEDDEINPLVAEASEKIAQTQQEMDNILSSRMQAEDELKSINARTDLSVEEKARVVDGIKARMGFNDALLRDAQAKLQSQGATFDGFDGKAGLEFDPYALTQTDIELTRIADEQKASDRLYDELRQARQTIRDTADGLDAAKLQDRVTTLSERLTGNADEINQLADDLDTYTKGIRVTRKQGELEYLSAMAESAVAAAEFNLAYVENVYKTARNAEVALLLITAGGAAVGVGGLTAAAAAAQGIMAAFEGASGAIEAMIKAVSSRA
ncbi:hypothetical protein OO012_02160 [Rhodobacteraceae bacterium KMM 6894]|nr:hypothetical protein [Rhodobacteraceae bacterium KMM 6894]